MLVIEGRVICEFGLPPLCNVDSTELTVLVKYTDCMVFKALPCQCICKTIDFNLFDKVKIK